MEWLFGNRDVLWVPVDALRNSARGSDQRNPTWVDFFPKAYTERFFFSAIVEEGGFFPREIWVLGIFFPWSSDLRSFFFLQNDVENLFIYCTLYRPLSSTVK